MRTSKLGFPRFLVFVALSCSLWFGAVGLAADPDLQAISPPGVQRGVATEITFTGDRLDGAYELVFHTPGVQVTDVTQVDGKNVKATVLVPEDYPLDLHPFHLVTKSGLSNLRYLAVGNLPVVNEAEPNSDFASPQAIALDSTVHGIVTSEDVDYYEVELAENEELSVELEGLRLAYMYNFFDPAVTVYDEKRFEVASSDDNPLVQQDCVCTLVAPRAGKYIVEVRDSSYGGHPHSHYRLHIGRFKRPMAVYPAGGQPGTTINATWIDSLGNAWQEPITFPEQPVDAFPVWSMAGKVQAPSPNRLRVNDLANVLETPDNDDPNQVDASQALPVAFNGILEKEGDYDWYGFTATKDQQVEIKAYARTGVRSPVDPVIHVREKGGKYLAGNDDSGSPDSLINFKVPADGEYVVGIQDHLSAFGSHHVYRIELTLPKPEITVKVREQRRWIAERLNIPRGSRMALHTDIVRRFIGGDAVLSSRNLPVGVSQVAGSFAANRTDAPLLFEADADAPLTGGLVDLQASVEVNPELTVTGGLQQRVQLIRGQNNRDVWGYDSDRVGIAVVEALPFDIEVIQPEVPLVRYGSMSLTVRIRRDEGFKNAVSLYVLNPPPGVSASRAIKFEGEATEVQIPLTANQNALIGKWPLTVIAATNVGGRALLASPLFELDVADSLFEFQFNKASTEQGKPVDILLGVTSKGEIQGQPEIELLGVPPGTKLEQSKLPWSAEQTQLVFKLQVPPETREGQFKTIVARATVTRENGVITQTNGNGEVQIDKPLPAPTEVAAVEKPVETPKEPAEKPLTRLEQLRMQRKNSGK